MDFRPYLHRHLPPLMVAREAEIVEELAQHLEEVYREAIDDGLSHDEAWSRAMAAVPTSTEVSTTELATMTKPTIMTAIKVAVREMRAAINARLALRALFKFPFVTVVAIVSLALGIGANTAVFSIFNQWLLQPLPVPEPDRLVNLSAIGPKQGPRSCGMAGSCDIVFSYPMFRDLERMQTPFTALAAHRHIDANLTSRGQTSIGGAMLVSGRYFAAAGIAPALGRLLDSRDDRAVGDSPVAVLSHAYWQTAYGGRTDAIGETMIVNGQTLTIVGVAPAGFNGTTIGLRPEVFVPITLRWLMQPGRTQDHANRRSYWIYLFGRMKPGITIDQARTAINVPYQALINDVEVPLNRTMTDQVLARFKKKLIVVEPGRSGQSNLSRVTTMPLTLLLGVTLLVLLIACVNIANLLLARAAARSSEMAMRLSLGASRRQLIVQLLTESSVLALLGGVVSLLVAQWTLTLFASLIPAEDVRLPMALDSTALTVTAALAIGTSLLVGLFPALHATRPDVLSALKGLSGQAAGGRGAARFRTTLATAQIALSMVLVVLAGLFTKSLDNITRVDPRMNLDGLITFEIAPERNAYTPERTALLIERIEEELAALPGVTSATSASMALLADDGYWDSVRVEGFNAGPDADRDINYDEVGPGYFRTLGVPLIAGREFTRADGLKAAKVAIVNETFAKKFNLGRDAVGKRVSAGGAPTDALDIEIVGLVRDAHHINVKTAIPPMMFVPNRQNASVRSMTFYVRTAMNPDDAMPAIRGAVSRLDDMLPVEKLRTLHRQMRDETMVLDRFVGVLTASFAVLATLLAAIGLYGVLAYTVAQRTREIGLRMALGATRPRVRGMVLRQVGVMMLIGGAIGLAAALAAARTVRSLLFDLQFNDAGVLAAAVVVLTLIALAAGFLPADRAARIDPMRALRYE
jgi:predicted permease